jgi:hypothetical protein
MADLSLGMTPFDKLRTGPSTSSDRPFDKLRANGGNKVKL